MHPCRDCHKCSPQYLENGTFLLEQEGRMCPPSEQAWAQGHFSSVSSCKSRPQRCGPARTQRDWHCPVCLQTPTFPIRTNCGHLYCAPCLITYWKHGSWLGAVSCPLCRQEVSVLHHLFTESRMDQQVSDVLADITHYNKRFSGSPRQVTDYLYDVPHFLGLFLRSLGNLGGLVGLFLLRVTVCMFGALTAMASSWETNPEPFCGLLGLLDDVAVVSLLLISVVNVRQEMRSQEAAMTRASACPERDPITSHATTTDGFA
ncbi:E3 ubiquitin-protein ligase RNF170-like [Brienomyrus brachyistius]|uniref:E3 ubiquitin-protein ligase RNF170-like n=1 Tax=Brienomyrus brachyistius TaxID=42636 RepID=UPI0020B17D74|nr:E3 ubiquitin-protein ligase RNF170-like [Brienomyrus brachyistius]